MISISGAIPIRIHPFFGLVAILIGWLNSLSLLGTFLWVIVITLSVLVHEYGHALTALVFGQRSEINLIGLGGLTVRKGGKLKLWKEFVVVLNGPIAGFCLAIVCYYLKKIINPAEGTVSAYLLTIAIWINVFWTLVNLLPIQPLDGGRLLSILLESILGIRGIKTALFLGMALSACLGVFFILTHNLFAGAIFFLFAFENYRSWRSSLEINEQDQSIALQHLLKTAEQEMRVGHTQEALDKFMRIREMASRGIIYQAASQHAALLLSQTGRYDEAYELLGPLQHQLSPENLRLLHHLAYDTKRWQEIIRTANEAFQHNPDYDTALINAYAYAHAGDVRPAVGWLQCAVREGLPNLREILSRPDFDVIREKPEFDSLFRQ